MRQRACRAGVVLACCTDAARKENPMPSETCRIIDRDTHLVVVNDNPRRRNALTPGFQAGLTQALADCRPEMIYLPVEWLDTLDVTPYLDRTAFCAVLERNKDVRDAALSDVRRLLSARYKK